MLLLKQEKDSLQCVSKIRLVGTETSIIHEKGTVPSIIMVKVLVKDEKVLTIVLSRSLGSDCSIEPSRSSNSHVRFAPTAIIRKITCTPHAARTHHPPHPPHPSHQKHLCMCTPCSP
jgi:hypothetical protein